MGHIHRLRHQMIPKRSYLHHRRQSGHFTLEPKSSPVNHVLRKQRGVLITALKDSSECTAKPIPLQPQLKWPGINFFRMGQSMKLVKIN